jgi:hypothetical protein
MRTPTFQANHPKTKTQPAPSAMAAVVLARAQHTTERAGGVSACRICVKIDPLSV